ncbi:hypothetical protein EDD36DRAFT_428667 [Exophiala viscosa]|uniref:Uncharacterized protein n=1 Tax=Exophiala viscosa TaxID=2486360 RepID=A0AAN6IG25_9EURO|nr:hypothetical protein EDD36DRAFT_428667 [Exophiala viscosa]
MVFAALPCIPHILTIIWAGMLWRGSPRTKMATSLYFRKMSKSSTLRYREVDNPNASHVAMLDNFHCGSLARPR